MSLKLDEFEELRLLLRRYPALQDAELGELRMLYRRSSMADRILLLNNPEHERKLRIIEARGIVGLGDVISWALVAAATALVLALMLRMFM